MRPPFTPAKPCLLIAALALLSPDSAVGAPFVLGTTPGDTVTINGAVFTTTNAQAAGTGLISSFLRIQSPGSSSFEQGYNTGTPRGTFPSGFPDFDQKKGNFTFDIQLGTVPKVGTSPNEFRRVLLDVNEPGNSSSSAAKITLNRLLVFVGGAANAFLNGNLANLGNLGTLVFDLDGNEDNSLEITDVFPGSGAFDMAIDLPESLFTNHSAAEIFRIFAEFDDAEGGFEEFAARGIGGGGGPGVEDPPISPPVGVPEPGSIALWTLLGLGACGAGMRSWKKRRRPRR